MGSLEPDEKQGWVHGGGRGPKMGADKACGQREPVAGIVAAHGMGHLDDAPYDDQAKQQGGGSVRGNRRQPNREELERAQTRMSVRQCEGTQWLNLSRQI